MQENIEKAVSWAKIFAWVALPLLGGVFVYQYARSVSQISYRTFSVEGTGEIEALPNTAQFSASVITEGGKEVDKVQQENVQKANAVAGFFKERGVDPKDIKTTDYTINPRYEYPRCLNGTSCPPPVIAGYSASQSVTVKVKDVAKLGDLLAGAVQSGANSVSEVTFVLDNAEAARDEARKEAIQEARTKAEALAQAGGFRLGRLVSLHEERGEGPVFSAEPAMGGGGVKEVPQVMPGSQDVEVKMILTYEIR
jgi:uncharacterized protein YggE